eukprot:10095809-Prorocentrum_lima.AAC.1
MERGQRQLHSKLLGTPMKQLQCQGSPKLKNQVGAGWEQVMHGHTMSLIRISKSPTGPAPEQGFHDPINKIRPPPQGPEQQVGP